MARAGWIQARGGLPQALDPGGKREQALLIAARDGDTKALTTIYERHAPSIMRRLRWLTGDAELAAEIVQETFVVAFGDLNRFSGGSALGAWLHGIAFNLGRQAVRKRARRRRLQQAHRAPMEALQGAPPVDPESITMMSEAAGRLEAAVAALPAKQREAFILRVVERMPLREAAELLGVRVSTLSYRAKRAEAKVRELFQQENGR